ncbi:phosphoglycolate phosphatase [Streptomyces sp. DfronAA-171]|nr:phosphoglycolate phosphatase [Streptomyces sp. DfronAA-171]
MPQDIAPSDLATSQDLAADASAVPLSETTDGGPVVGFDLDMTLVDSRRGIGAVYRALAAETGADIDVDLVTSRLGPPLEHEMANWFPPEQVVAMSDRYRALYPEHAIADTTAMPGAREAIAAVRAAGGRVLVVTAKNRAHAALHLSHLGLEPDLLIGGLWAEAKGTALRAQGASVYVGDHDRGRARGPYGGRGVGRGGDGAVRRGGTAGGGGGRGPRDARRVRGVAGGVRGRGG